MTALAIFVAVAILAFPRNNQSPTGGAPDDHILAWLRERERITEQVPGRRQTIEQWALGSTRADRLRATVIKEAPPPKDPTPAA